MKLVLLTLSLYFILDLVCLWPVRDRSNLTGMHMAAPGTTPASAASGRLAVAKVFVQKTSGAFLTSKQSMPTPTDDDSDNKASGKNAADEKATTDVKDSATSPDNDLKNLQTTPAPGAEKGLENQHAAPKGPKDRRWIIKQSDSKKEKPARNIPPAFSWLSTSQKERCESRLKLLQDNFLRARYYSIKGDSCACADHAQEFLNLADASKRDCPENYLEKNGYTSRIIRNLEWLNELGTKRCLGNSSRDAAQ